MSIQWRKVDLRYSVSEEGHVRNDKTGRQLNPVTTSNGYLQVSLRFSGKTVSEYVHRLVAKAFLQAKDGCDHVNHIDGDKKNNRSTNLEWCTQADNNRHAVRTGLNKSTKTSVEKMNRATRKAVEQVSVETGEVVATFESYMAARRATGFTAIHDCISKRQKTAGGFIWRYVRCNMGEAA